MRSPRALLPLALSLCAGAGLAQDTGNTSALEPISAIDWLSHSLLEAPAALPNGGAVTTGIVTEPITVQPLDEPSPDGVGLLPRAVTGLPANLWGQSDIDDLTRQIAEFPAEALPAIQDQFRRVMLAELDPPQGTTPRAPLLQARIDALLARGAVEEAEALLQRADSDEPELFRRSFDVALLTGREQAACAQTRAQPGLSPSYPVRIFCLARTGDWNAAALTLESAKALGQLSEEEDALLAQFLDPDLADEPYPVSEIHRTSPLTFRMLEAIGTPLPTTALPLAFAHSDLRPSSGWKARIEAAERLARAGALPADVLMAIYGERAPAASGGVWERVSAVQTLSKALSTGDSAAISDALQTAWDEMGKAGLALPLAQAFSTRLLSRQSPPDPLAVRMGLISDQYESVALDAAPAVPDLAFAASIARGTAEGAPQDDLARAIAAAFSGTGTPPQADLEELATEQRFGEALLGALRVLARGADGDPNDIAGALGFLRKIGLEDTARRAALQMLLLGRTA